MKPTSVIPTASALYQVARSRRLQAAAGTLVRCEVCGREFAPRLVFTARYGRMPGSFTPGKVCSQTCVSELEQRARRKP